MSGEIIPIGKYKGQPLEAVAADQQYRDWLMAQEWFKEKFARLYGMLAAMNAPIESPEHNAMQARFLDDRVCYEILWKLEGKDRIAVNAERHQKCIDVLVPRLQSFNDECEVRRLELIEKSILWGDEQYKHAIENVYPEQLKQYHKDLWAHQLKLEAWGANLNRSTYDKPYPPRKPEPRKREEWPTAEFSRYTYPHPALKKLAYDFSFEKFKLDRKFEANGADVELLLFGGYEGRVAQIEPRENRWHSTDWSTRDGETTSKLEFCDKQHEFLFDSNPIKFPRLVKVHHRIELKPMISDDYPAVLRQVMKSECRAVVVDAYLGSTVPWEQVQAIFKSQGVKLIKFTSEEPGEDDE